MSEQPILIVESPCCLAEVQLKEKSASGQVVHTAGAYLGFCGIKQTGVFLLPLLHWMPVHHRVIPVQEEICYHLTIN